MTRIERMSCRIGLHKWNQWNINCMSLKAEGGKTSLAADLELSIEIKSRTCMRCSKDHTMKVLHW